MSVVTTNIDQDAASLGAAAIAKRAAGEWGDFSGISALHTVRNVYTPDAGRHAAYLDIFRRFILASDMLSDLGDRLREA
jgi:xylulokinase